MEDDLSIAIGLILHADDQQLARELATHLENVSNANAEVRKRLVIAEERQASAARKTVYDKAMAATQAQMREQFAARSRDEKKFAQADLKAYQHILNQRLRALEHALIEERRANRAADFSALAAQKEVNKERLAATAASYRRGEAEARQSERIQLEGIRTAGRSQYVAEQASQARRTALFKSFLKGLNQTYATTLRAGNNILSASLRTGQNVVSSWLERRKDKYRQVNQEITSVESRALERQTSEIRAKLDEQNRAYTAAARKRLTTIERSTATETRAITAAEVRRTEAQAALARRTNTGVIGAATGRSTLGNQLQAFAALAGGTLIIRDIAAETTEALKAGRQTAQVIKSTGGAAHVTKKQVEDLANSISVMAGIDDEAVQGTTNLLLTFTNIRNEAGKTNKILNLATQAVVDMSAVQGNLKSNSILVGKALQDPIKGVTALRRVGVRLSAQQEDQIKLFVKQGKLAEAQKIVLRELAVEFGGQAAAQATAGEKLTVVYKNIEESIGTFLYPAIAKLATGFATLFSNLAYGDGIFAAVRAGLLGVAAALAAIIAAKAAPEILGLVNTALKLIALNPGIAALLALGAAAGILYKRAPGIREFFGSLVHGTVEWFKVGYRIKEPIKDLSLIVRLQTSLGFAARVIRDFFASLVHGTIEWFKVGYRIKEPISDLSAIVLFQTSFGVAARGIRDGLYGIADGIKTLVSGGGPKQLHDAVVNTRKELATGLAPAKDSIAKPLKKAVDEAITYLQGVRLNVGVFLLSALGLTGGNGGLVSRLVHSALKHIFLGAVEDFADQQTAAQMGKQVHDLVSKAIDYAVGAGLNVGRFFQALFTGDFKLGDTANNLGIQLRLLVLDGLHRLGDLAQPVLDAFGDLGGKIGKFFTDKILPRIIDLPRIIGRTLSRTLFREGFLKALGITAAALAVTAIVIAGQFVRGFLEGIWQRRGDIAKVIFDTLKFAATAVISSGNPFIIVTAAIVAAVVAGLAGAKIAGAITSLRGQFRVAALAIKGDMAGAQAASDGLRESVEKTISGPGGKIGNAALGLGNFARSVQGGFDKAAIGVYRLGGVIDKTGVIARKAASVTSVAFDSAGKRVQALGDQILKTTDLAVTANGRLRNTKTNLFVADPTKDLSRARVAIGQFVVRAGESLQSVPIKAKAAFASVGSTAQAAFTKVSDTAKAGAAKVKGYFSQVNQEAQVKFSATSAAVTLAASAATGAALGMADDMQSILASGATSVATIATSFAINPILGAISAATVLVTAFIAHSKKEADKAKALAKEQAAEIKSINAATRKSFVDTFLEIGSTGNQARAAAVLGAIGDNLRGAESASSDFKKRFKADNTEIAAAAATGGKALKAYTDSLIDDQVKKVLDGNTDAMKAFGNQVDHSISSAVDSTHVFDREVQNLYQSFQRGKITRQEFISGLEKITGSNKVARETYEAYKKSIAEDIGNTRGAIFLKSLPGTMQQAIDKANEEASVNEELQRRLSLFDNVAERFKTAWDKIKGAIDDAKNAYEDWIDATTGKQQTQNQAILDLAQAAREATGPAPEGETPLEKQARDSQNRIDAMKTVSGQIAQLAAESGGDVDVLNRKLGAFFDSLRRNAPTQAQKDFFTLLQKSIPQDSLLNVLSRYDTINNFRDLEGQVAALLQLPTPENIKLKAELEKAPNYDAVKRVLADDINQLAKSDPTIAAFLKKDPANYQKVLQQLIDDAGYIDTLNPTLKVKLEMNIRADFQRGLAKFNKEQAEKGGPILSAGGQLVDPKTGKIIRSAAGRYVTRPIVSTLGEEGPEVVLPLTKPQRMRELLSIPQVSQAVADAAPAPAPSAAAPFAQGTVTNGGDFIIQNQNIYETTSPRLTAIETVRKNREAQFLGGRTLTRRPVTTGAMP